MFASRLVEPALLDVERGGTGGLRLSQALCLLRRSALVAVALFALVSLWQPQTVLAATYIVNSTGDGGDSDLGNATCNVGGGECTLRAAISQSNAIGGSSTINFGIPGAGLQSIIPGSPLPAITVPILIDGTTQDTSGNGQVLIQLYGGNAGPANGLMLQGAGSTIRGLAINGFGSGTGVIIQASNVTIAHNIIGADASGSFAVSNAFGVVVQNVPGATIGGTTAGAGNLISGNGPGGGGVGVYIGGASATGARVLGNAIGLNIDGTVAIANHFGVHIDGAPGVVVGGPSAAARNIISGNVERGIIIAGSGASIQGNYIGTNATGTAALPNDTGIYVFNVANATLGGLTAGAGNVISGNTSLGVLAEFAGSTGLTVQGNFIGTNAAGTAALPNAYGVFTTSVPNVTIGGTTSIARNVISGNVLAGLYVFGSSSGYKVQGNYIGTNAGGTAAIGNATGVLVDSVPGVLVGGTAANERNVISGNSVAGVTISQGLSIGATIRGNYIGTNAAGTAAVGNTTGVLIDGSPGATIGGNLISGNTGTGVSIVLVSAAGATVAGNRIGTDSAGTGAIGNGTGVVVQDASAATIGGTVSAAANTIANNAGHGVAISGGIGNVIRRNSIFNNGQLGIDLGSDGLTVNDAGDNDLGSNMRQNYPVLTGVSPTSIQGTLNSVASRTYQLDFFNNAACEPSGFGEGRTYLATVNVSTNAAGNATFNVPISPSLSSGQVTSTATDPDGNTSEFSGCVPVAGQTSVPNLTVTAGSPVAAHIALNWTGGTPPLSYYLARIPSGEFPFAAPANSFTDTAPLTGPNCYVLVPVGPAGPIGQSDLLCGQVGFHSATGDPKKLSVALNQSPVAQLAWIAPGGPISTYYLLAIPLDSGAPRVTQVSAGLTATTDNTGGIPTCYVLFAPSSSGVGNSDLVCAFPGVAGTASAASVESAEAAGAASADDTPSARQAKAEAKQLADQLTGRVSVLKSKLDSKLKQGTAEVKKQIEKDRPESPKDDPDEAELPDRAVPDGAFLNRSRNGRPLAGFGGENVYDTNGDGDGGSNVARGDGPRIVGSKSIPFRIENDGGRADRIKLKSVTSNRELTDITISVNGLSVGDATDRLDEAGGKLDGNIVVKVGRQAAKGTYVVKIVLQASDSSDSAQSDSVIVRFRV